MFWRMQPKRLDLPDSFARIVERERETKHISRAGLATKAGLHQTYIGLLERGKRTPNLETAQAIAEALGFPLSVLIAKAEELANGNTSPQS